VQLSDIELPEVPGWDEFQERKASGGKAAAVPIRRPKMKKPAASEAPPATLAELLMQAVRVAIARRGREAREIVVREETLLEVLSEAMRRPAQ
jgi:hypothetical protein